VKNDDEDDLYSSRADGTNDGDGTARTRGTGKRAASGEKNLPLPPSITYIIRYNNILTLYLKCIIFISKEDLTMITAELEAKPVINGIDGLDGVPEDESEYDYEYVYPQELLDKWAKLGEELDLKIASGEAKPITVQELAAKFGIKMDSKK